MLPFSKPDVEQFFRTFTIEDFAVSPDEKQLIFSTNLNGKFNLWAMDLPHTFPYPLTFVDQCCHTIHYDQQGRFVLVGFDRDGDENHQLYAMPPRGGQLQPIRVSEGDRHFFCSLSKDGERLYYSSTKGNRTFLNSYRYNLLNDEEETLLEGEEAPTILIKVSPEETSFVYVKYFANTHQLVYVRKDSEDIRMTPPTNDQHTVSGMIYASEDEIYFLTNCGEDFTYLANFDLRTRKFAKILALENEDFSSMEYDKDRGLLYLVSSKGVEDCLYQYDLSDKKLQKLDTPVHVIEKIVLCEAGNLYLLGQSATRPKNIYLRTTDQKEWKELTYNRVPGVAEEQLVEPELVTYTSFDGLKIEALYMRAKKEASNGYLILWPHGGPQAAERKTFRALFQYLANRGYSIFAPNFRGSAGYGHKFMKMVEGDWGYGPRLDIIHGLEWLIENGYANRDRLLVMGGSYGGYMALLLVGRHPEYFKACVDMFGPSNLFTSIETAPDFWKPMMKQWIGDPEKDKEKLIEDSPITYTDQMASPMLVIQGANDPRVVRQESDQIVAALQSRGVDVEYMLLEDEGHGFSKKENEMKVYRKVVEFFDHRRALSPE